MSQKDNYSHLSFNRGLLSPLGFGRIDLRRTAVSAETQTNWIPRVLGAAMLRPGLEYSASSRNYDAAVNIPFIFSKTDTAILSFTDGYFRIIIDGDPISRPVISTTITNGDFTTDITTGWTNSDESGATSSWLDGSLKMVGNNTNSVYCKLDQEITVATSDQDVEHGLNVVVSTGPVEIKIGSSQGAQDYFGYSLGTGVHYLSLTPTGNFWIRLRSKESYPVITDSVSIAPAGLVEVPTDRDETDISSFKFDQSGDIIFIACKDKQQTKIERRATKSWSWTNYETEDGPFLTQNIGGTTLLPSALYGEVTLTASVSLFEDSHVGALFSISSSVQDVIAENISVEDTWTDPILITGVDEDRYFNVEITGLTDTGTEVTRQRSISEVGSWVDYGDPFTEDFSGVKADFLDNQVVYYRLGVKAGSYVAGTPTCELSIEAGSITGICKVTAVASSTSATANVLQSFGSSTTASSDWAEGQWSERSGYPSAVAFHEGRIFWAGKDKLNGSVTDSFYSFDPDYDGDAGPINRSLGQGPVDNINWLSSGKTLMMGCDGSIKMIRSSSLDEPLTSSNFTIKDAVTQGASSVSAIKVDTDVVFVQASGVRVYNVGYNSTTYDYAHVDLTSIVPEIGLPSIVKIVVQRQPDTRIHCVRSDGNVALLVYDKIEDVKCWVLVETDGTIEDAVVLPGLVEDEVYYLVNRTINGSTVRWLEKWSLESENKGGEINKLADSHFIYSGESTATITGLYRLEGEEVIVWGNSKDLGTYTVESEQITLTEAVTWCCIGLAYQADFKSAKPAFATANGSSLLQKKIISQLGLLLSDTHKNGLTYGPDFDHLDDLPAVENGVAVDDDYVWESYDEEAFQFPGTWDTDSRVCFRAMAPRPCTVLALVVDWNTNEKV